MEFEYNWVLRELSECRNEVLRRLDQSSSIKLGNASFEIDPTVSSSLLVNSCSKCPGFSYYSTEEFREHSKSEWHLFNLKHPSSGLNFEQWSAHYLDVDSGDSCSSSLSDSEILEAEPTPSRLILNSIAYHPIGDSGVAFPSAASDTSALLNANYICVLILRSGRFAGAVWDRSGNVVVHSCMKRYTVRRKNGGSQRKCDNAKGSPANSIGAQIRRNQEHKLSEEIEQLVTKKWYKYLSSSTAVVFAYSSKSQTQSLFVGPLEKSKSVAKVFHIPMSVRDPTYAEVCRIYSTMTKIALSS